MERITEIGITYEIRLTSVQKKLCRYSWTSKETHLHSRKDLSVQLMVQFYRSKIIYLNKIDTRIR